MRTLILLFFWLTPLILFSQNYTNYFTGNTEDSVVQAMGGICLMGGATENDEAMKWFLQRANGGDVLILRTSGSDGYNDYLYSDLGITVNSVESIVFNNASAANESYIHEKIAGAEAIWMAGGNQWNYVNYWRDSPIDSLINDGLANRRIVIGGTSAGMAVQGGIYFSAQNGTVTSATALSNPYASSLIVDSTDFLHNPFLSEVITDTHFDNPDRRGRTTTFLARILQDYGIQGRAIACDEYTAVCIDSDGRAYVYGEYPDYEDNAYFVQVNCGLNDPAPELCTPGSALDWNKSGEALKVYRIQGTLAGDKYFDLNNWESGEGGTWLHWSVDQGNFSETNGSAPDCLSTSTEDLDLSSLNIYPNPVDGKLIVESPEAEILQVQLLNIYSQVLRTQKTNGFRSEVPCAALPAGIYYLRVETEQGQFIHKFIKE